MTDGRQTTVTQGGLPTGRGLVFVHALATMRADLDMTRVESEWELAADELPPLAAHVVSSRFGYSHHGIHVGDGRVIHYAGLSRGWRSGPVEEVSLAEFGKGRAIRVRMHEKPRFDRDAVIARARSRLGENRYRALSNNCEHLCNWCIHGENSSRQVEALRSVVLKMLQRVRGVIGQPLRLRSLPWLTVNSGNGALQYALGLARAPTSPAISTDRLQVIRSTRPAL